MYTVYSHMRRCIDVDVDDDADVAIDATAPCSSQACYGTHFFNTSLKL